MADGATCTKFFGRDYFCGPMALGAAASTPPPTVAPAPEVKAEEPKEHCRYVRDANEFVEVCRPRPEGGVAPSRTIFDVLGDAVKFILETNAKYQPMHGPRR